jgi:N6-L-threonylcarbamoyladenine synthase
MVTKNSPVILAIESSCDETAVAIYQEKLLAHALHSQIARHQLYGGVVPELASRDHLSHIIPLVSKALADASLNMSDIDIFAYTQGPGLAGCLLVGATVAKTLAMVQKKPSLPIHHLEGHLLAPFLENSMPVNCATDFESRPESEIKPESERDTQISKTPHLSQITEQSPEKTLSFPYLALLVSGGHTQFIAVKDVNEYHILGDTLDDALGEAFDKTAKMLGLAYPGGAEVSKKAEKGKPIFDLPTPMIASQNLDMSFAGLKTAVLYLIQAEKAKAIHAGLIHSLDDSLPDDIVNHICASFVHSVIKVMRKKTSLAIDIFAENFLTHPNSTHINKSQNSPTTNKAEIQLVITGGVGANQQLRAALKELAQTKNAALFYPAIEWCTDNAAMIAIAAAFKCQKNLHHFDQNLAIQVKPRWLL